MRIEGTSPKSRVVEFMIEFGEFNWWILVLILIAGGGIVYFYVKRPSFTLFALRAAACMLAILLLIQPTYIKQEKIRGKPLLAVLVDNSQSMAVKDPEQRLSRVKEFIARHITLWKRRADLRFYLFSGSTSLTSEDAMGNWKAQGNATSIGHAISEIGNELSGKLSSMVLLSDGRDNGVLQPAHIARKLNVPIFSVGVGSPEKIKDILISDLRAGDFAFKNTPINVRLMLKGYGFAGKKIPVRLYHRKELIATREVKLLPRAEDTEVNFEITPKNVGTFAYRASIPVYPGEASKRNNSINFSIDVIREKLRILYICGQPGYEYALLREALKSDPAVELVSFVILRNPENIAFVPDRELSLIPFPAREIFLKKLFSFDLLIFENFTYVRFGIIAPYLENIRTFIVEKGGAFIMIGGQNSFGSGRYGHTPIEDILPVIIDNQSELFKIEPFRMRATTLHHPIMLLADDMKKNRTTWRTMPQLVGYNTIGRAKEGAVVLGEHPWKKNDAGPLPVLVVWQKGKGRVMVITSNTTWRWAMGLAKEGKTPFGYTRFWRQTVRWLTQAEEMKLVLVTVDKRQYSPGETMRINVMVKDEAYDPLTEARVSLRIKEPDGITREIVTFRGEKGEFHAEYEPWGIGTYTVKAEAYHKQTGTFLGSDSRNIDVRAFSRETIELNMDEQLLADIASQSGGSYSRIDSFETKDLFKSLKIRHRGEVLKKKPIWNHPVFFILILLLLITEWFIRRRTGLP